MNDNNEEARRKTTWKKKFDFFFYILGWTVGLGNVWRFPYLCYQNGGGAFLVAYFTIIVIFAFPIMVLESTLGQYTGHVVISAWKVIPFCSGIGYASMLIKIYGLFYPVLLAWALRWFLGSFSNPLPWTTCGNPWNTDKCFEFRVSTENATFKARETKNMTISPARSSSVEEYWRRNVLGMTSGLEDYGDMKWDLFGCLLAIWVINYFSLFKGINWTSKIIYVTSTLPLAMMIIVTVRGATLPAAWEGVSVYLKPDIQKLGHVKVWKEAASQVMYSLGVCLGMYPTLSSYNKYHHNFLRDLLCVVIANALVSLTSGFAIFSVLGFLANNQNISVNDVAESGPGLVFVIYPTALSLLPLPQFWSALFFLMLLLLGLDSMFSALEMIFACFKDIFPKFFRKKWSTETGLFIVVVLGFLYSSTMITEGGIYFLHIVNSYAAVGWCVFFLALGELIGIGWLYGSDRMLDNMEDMLGYKVPRLWFKLCWKILTPIVVTILMVYSLIQYRPLVYDRVYVYPAWANGLGWMMTLSSVLFVPGFAIRAIWKMEGDGIRQKFRRSVTASPVGRNINNEVTEKFLDTSEAEEKL